MFAMSLIHWIVLIFLLSGLIYSFSKMGKRKIPIPARIFIFGALLSPISSLGSTSMMIDSAVKEFPALTSLPGWETEKNMLWFFCFLASSFLFSSGVLLFKNQNISALQRAKKILLVFLAISFLYHLWILVLFGVDQASFDFVIDGLAKSCAYTIIWYAYLSKSKNIKNVYC